MILIEHYLKTAWGTILPIVITVTKIEIEILVAKQCPIVPNKSKNYVQFDCNFYLQAFPVWKKPKPFYQTASAEATFRPSNGRWNLRHSQCSAGCCICQSTGRELFWVCHYKFVWTVWLNKNWTTILNHNNLVIFKFHLPVWFNIST